MIDVAIIDRDDTALWLLSQIVQELGYTVKALHLCGVVDEVVCRFIRETQPRLVIYDLGPPPVDEAIARWQRICAAPGCSHMHYIITTAARPPFKTLNTSVCGATVTVLPHPFGESELQRELLRTIGPP